MYYVFTGYSDRRDRVFSKSEVATIAKFHQYSSAKDFIEVCKTYGGVEPGGPYLDREFEPTVLEFVIMNRMHEAIKLYKKQHPDASEKIAKTKCYSMRQDVKDSRKRNARLDKEGLIND